MQFLREGLRKPGFRYLFVGGSVYLFELVVIAVAQGLGASAVAAVAWSFMLGLAVSFLLQKFFTFGDRRTRPKVVVSQSVAVCLLVAWNFGFTLLLTKLLENALPPMVTRTVALGLTTIWNFYLYKTRIFNPTRQSDAPID